VVSILPYVFGTSQNSNKEKLARNYKKGPNLFIPYFLDEMAEKCLTKLATLVTGPSQRGATVVLKMRYS
jgi:hypothetical protein